MTDRHNAHKFAAVIIEMTSTGKKVHFNLFPYIMDKYYEMFRGKNSANIKDLFNSPDSPDHSDLDSDADG